MCFSVFSVYFAKFYCDFWAKISSAIKIQCFEPFFFIYRVILHLKHSVYSVIICDCMCSFPLFPIATLALWNAVEQLMLFTKVLLIDVLSSRYQRSSLACFRLMRHLNALRRTHYVVLSAIDGKISSSECSQYCRL